jgi:hypothetical protein
VQELKIGVAAAAFFLVPLPQLNTIFSQMLANSQDFITFGIDLTIK